MMMDQQADLSADTEPLGLQTAMNGHDSSADSTLHLHPSPGLPDDTGDTSSRDQPVTAFSQSDRDGVLTALQSLQEKMRKLEVERRAAESSLQTLTSETQLYKSSLHQPHFVLQPHPHPHPDIRLHTPPREEEEEEKEEEEEEEREKDGYVVQLCNDRPHQKQLESQLSSAETRCQLLEKQLEYMRQMVTTAHTQHSQAGHSADTLQMQHQQKQQKQQQKLQQQQKQQKQNGRHTPSPILSDYLTQLERIGELERDHSRLTASQSLAESRIRELEARLGEERQHWTTTEPHKTRDVESHEQQKKSAVSPKATPPAPPPHEGAGHPTHPPPSTGQRKKGGCSNSNSNSSSSSKKKKKKKVSTRKTAAPASRTEASSKHFRLNLADIPFVAGKSTAPSHAVGANVQKVLAMMKSHNHALCSSSASCCSSSSSPLSNGHGHIHSHTHLHGGCNGESVGRLRGSTPKSPSPPSIPAELDLSDLLTQLQEEFAQLSLEHQEFLREVQDSTDPRIHQDLQRELDVVTARMEVKGQQIATVRQHQNRLEDVRLAAKRRGKKSEPVPRPTSALGRLQTNHKHVHPNVSGNIRPKSSSTRSERDAKHAELAPPTLSVLRDMRKLQTTLRRDDLCWE